LPEFRINNAQVGQARLAAGERTRESQTLTPSPMLFLGPAFCLHRGQIKWTT
jgi:hypothetical protein